MRAAQNIAYGHISDRVEGHVGDFPGMTTAQVADLIYHKMQRAVTNASGLTIGASKSDRVPVIYDPKDDVLIIRDNRPNAPDGGTAFKPDDLPYVTESSVPTYRSSRRTNSRMVPSRHRYRRGRRPNLGRAASECQTLAATAASTPLHLYLVRPKTGERICHPKNWPRLREHWAFSDG